MLPLQTHHIVDLYCWVVESLAITPPRTGRPARLTSAEIVTVLIWCTLVLKQKTLKDIHRALALYHRQDFPSQPKYSTFVETVHRALPAYFELLTTLLSSEEAVRIMDSTMLPVCKPYRADSHKTARDKVAFGKNWQGWHFGFKLHASVSLGGKLCALALTGANVYDAQMEHLLLNKYTKIAVGDTLYGARVMRERMWKRYGTIIIAPPHPKQRKKIAALWQIELLHARSKIESVFDILKEHLHFVSSFPRSMNGYLVHYVRILLSYQIMALGRAV
jgi:Transposase DDE domain